jgi:hypothetical protein
MKKILLGFAIVFAFLTSCENELKGPAPIGAWRTTHQYFSRTIAGAGPYQEALSEILARETSVDVSEQESYRLTFRDNGTGSGSGFVPEINWRWDFNFTWKLSDNEITVRGNGSWERGYDTVFVWPEGPRAEWIKWEIESSTANEMVLVMESWRDVDDFDGSTIGIPIPWTEIHTYRYTFEKVK